MRLLLSRKRSVYASAKYDDNEYEFWQSKTKNTNPERANAAIEFRLGAGVHAATAAATDSVAPVA
tara:strand:+ start:104 stop:298 length:195 start_codon:yes stop_codon:yes gene_type:complete